MQNEEVGRQIYMIVCNTAKQGLQMMINYYMNKNIFSQINHNYKPELTHGEQDLQSLYKHNQPLSSVDISGDSSLRNFREIAAQYNVDFAVKQNPETKEYVIFFKARDSEVMERVFGEYQKSELNKKPSIIERMAEKQKSLKEAEKVMENGINKGIEKVNETVERTL